MTSHTGIDMTFLTDLLNEPLNHLIEQSIDNGKTPIGYTCSYVPDVLLSVDSLLPIRIRAPGVIGTEIADIYLSSVICSYTRSVLELAMDDQYDFISGWIFAASCDHMRRLYDNLDHILAPELVHILDVPHRTGEIPLAWYIRELKMLMDKLSSHLQIDFSEPSLTQAIEDHNQFSALLTSIGDFRKMPQPPLSGTEFQALTLAAGVAPKGSLLPEIQRFKESLSEREAISDFRARLLLVGGQMDNLDYIKTIESTGGLIVADHLCTGSIPNLKPIRMDEDPIQAIAGHYLNRISCPRMMEALDDRVEEIMNSVEEYRVDGVIVEFIKFCDTWAIESTLLATALREKGIPVLCLEREYRMTGEGQIRTRVQAFIESMGK